MALQAGAGAALVMGRWLLVSTALLGCLYGYLIVSEGVLPCLEYVNIPGILLFIAIWRLAGGYRRELPTIAEGRGDIFPVAVSILRISLGVSLIFLGFSEKILNPHMAMAFLNEFSSVNFMQYFFESFNHRVFILCAGSAEVLFGVIYVLGLVTRLNTIALAFFLVASNSYFFAVGLEHLAWMEFSGHTSLLATALILVVAGRGAPLGARSSVFRGVCVPGGPDKMNRL
ncbi:DoxX family membrane protein [Microbulbifer halophilus]